MYLQVSDILQKVELRNLNLGKKKLLSYKDSLCYTLRLHEVDEMLRYEQLCDIIMDLKGLTPEDIRVIVKTQKDENSKSSHPRIK